MGLYTGYGTGYAGRMHDLGEECMGSGQIHTLWEMLRKPVDHTWSTWTIHGPQTLAVCGHYKINAATPGVWVAGKS